LWPLVALAASAASTYAGCFLPDYEKIPGESTSGLPTGTGATGGAAGPGPGGQGGASAGGTGPGGTGPGGGAPDGCVAPPAATSDDPCADQMGSLMVRVPAEEGPVYCVDATEVSNAQYAAFLASTPMTDGQEPQCTWNMDFTPLDWMGADGIEDRPVAGVDWCDAFAYCAFVGKRLCGKVGGGPAAYGTAADEVNEQWYRACSAGSGTRPYPYGATYQAMACNGADADSGGVVGVGSAVDCEGGYCGIFDMAGNVAEWVDICDETTGAADKCYALGGAFEGPGLGQDSTSCLAAEDFPNGGVTRDTQLPTIGFRCCTE
jgi:formylglycine-generating enzyme required for sulfatase activity